MVSGFEIKSPPYFYPDGEGGQRLRITTPAGETLYYPMTETFALQCVLQGGLYLKKLAQDRRHPERTGELMEPVK